jgi:hypothetical protein
VREHGESRVVAWPVREPLRQASLDGAEHLVQALGCGAANRRRGQGRRPAHEEPAKYLVRHEPPIEQRGEPLAES